MAVYVDRLMYHGMMLYGKPQKTCHLYASSKAELIAFALSIGMKVRWLHKSKIGVEHFDLVPNKRKYAIEKGALEIKSYMEIIQ